MVVVPVVRAKAMGREPMLLVAGGGQSGLVGKLAWSGESAGVQAPPSLAPPWHFPSPAQMGQTWTPTEQNPPPVHVALAVHTVPLLVPPTQWSLPAVSGGNRSPSRKRVEVSGRLTAEAPLEQSAVPLASVATELMTHTLVGGLAGFGIGSGGPNRHPMLVQLRSGCVPPTSAPVGAAGLGRRWPGAGAVVGGGGAVVVLVVGGPAVVVVVGGGGAVVVVVGGGGAVVVVVGGGGAVVVVVGGGGAVVVVVGGGGAVVVVAIGRAHV